MRAAPRMPIRIGAATFPLTDATLALVPARSDAKVGGDSPITSRCCAGRIVFVGNQCRQSNLTRLTCRDLSRRGYGVRTPKLTDTRLHGEVSVWRIPLAGSIDWVPAVTTWVHGSAILGCEGGNGQPTKSGYLRIRQTHITPLVDRPSRQRCPHWLSPLPCGWAVLPRGGGPFDTH
jgi:hypothetical protein